MPAQHDQPWCQQTPTGRHTWWVPQGGFWTSGQTQIFFTYNSSDPPKGKLILDNPILCFQEKDPCALLDWMLDRTFCNDMSVLVCVAIPVWLLTACVFACSSLWYLCGRSWYLRGRKYFERTALKGSFLNVRDAQCSSPDAGWIRAVIAGETRYLQWSAVSSISRLDGPRIAVLCVLWQVSYRKKGAGSPPCPQRCHCIWG